MPNDLNAQGHPAQERVDNTRSPPSVGPGPAFRRRRGIGGRLVPIALALAQLSTTSATLPPSRHASTHFERAPSIDTERTLASLCHSHNGLLIVSGVFGIDAEELTYSQSAVAGLCVVIQAGGEREGDGLGDLGLPLQNHFCDASEPPEACVRFTGDGCDPRGFALACEALELQFIFLNALLSANDAIYLRRVLPNPETPEARGGSLGEERDEGGAPSPSSLSSPTGDRTGPQLWGVFTPIPSRRRLARVFQDEFLLTPNRRRHARGPSVKNATRVGHPPRPLPLDKRRGTLDPQF
ncbi:hypothetical protein FB107DRAFT_280292 [Schizophyllum commune]